MKSISEILLTGIIALVLSLILIPLFKKLAYKIGLLDKPNHRNLHKNPVPLIGGISVAVATGLALLTSNTFIAGIQEHIYMLGSALLLLLIGVMDDKMDIKPVYRLLIQLGCAYIIAATGIRITSFYGIFGIQEIPVAAQYFLTILVITGVVNAFNLMDGIDGLAGGLAVLGFIALTILSALMGKIEMTILFVAFIGAIIGFLRFNLNRKNKIFMGDGGSLFLGFLLVVSGLKLIESANDFYYIKPATSLLVVTGFFLVPVLDSLRVYRGRIKRGKSPFRADKSHLHHLFLLTGLNHRTTSVIIILLTLILSVVTSLLAFYFPLTLVLIMAALTFIVLTNLLNINKSLNEWKTKIREMESGS